MLLVIHIAAGRRKTVKNQLDFRILLPGIFVEQMGYALIVNVLNKDRIEDNPFFGKKHFDMRVKVLNVLIHLKLDCLWTSSWLFVILHYPPHLFIDK